MADRERLSVQVDPEMADAIRSLAADTGNRLSNTIRELLLIGLASFSRSPQAPPVSRIKENPFGE